MACTYLSTTAPNTSCSSESHRSISTGLSCTGLRGTGCCSCGSNTSVCRPRRTWKMTGIKSMYDETTRTKQQKLNLQDILDWYELISLSNTFFFRLRVAECQWPYWRKWQAVPGILWQLGGSCADCHRLWCRSPSVVHDPFPPAHPWKSTGVVIKNFFKKFSSPNSTPCYLCHSNERPCTPRQTPLGYTTISHDDSINIDRAWIISHMVNSTGSSGYISTTHDCSQIPTRGKKKRLHIAASPYSLLPAGRWARGVLGVGRQGRQPRHPSGSR